ncbi:MAG: TetR/AcrR family transcriptional regulator [Acidimicrobiia bacterium]
MVRSRQPLTPERVAGAARAVADREGLEQVTMRRVAAELGVEAMSLYHHVASKEALLDGLVEALVAEVLSTVARVEADAPDPSWRRTLRRRFLTARAVMLRHPWAPRLIAGRATAPPTLYAYYDGVVATMVEGGLSYHLAHRALHAFGSMPLGFSQELFAPAGQDAEADPAAQARMAELVPHLAAMVGAEVHAAGDDVLGWCDSQTEFEFTLDLLLDGLERQSLTRG